MEGENVMEGVSVLNCHSIRNRAGRRSKPGILFRAALLVGAALVCSSNLAMAQAGGLDITFGTGGVFTDSAGEFNNSGTSSDVVAVQSDGKIIAAGTIGFAAGAVRLNTNGTLDSSFGTGGTVTINFPGSNEGPSQVIGVAIQPDGKIVAGISNLNADANPLFILARLNPDGSLDTSFGSGGVIETQIGPFGSAAASVLALQSDGKILLAGSRAMARYNTTGQLDSTFGSGGIAAIAAASPTAMALQPDGKILIAAGGALPASLTAPVVGLASPAGVISRYSTSGNIDTTFGISGQAASVAAASAIVVQIAAGCVSTCKILVAGTVVSSLSVNGGNDTGFGLVRYSSNGNIDTSFGKRGGVITGFAPVKTLASAYALVLQTNGDIVAAGLAGQASGTQGDDFALARYSGSGVIDTTFGSSGRVTTAFGTNAAAIYGLAVQSDGKIVAAGLSLQSGQSGQVGGLVVARYLGQ
jgi:uncharacterized delta-60 repeat protein